MIFVNREFSQLKQKGTVLHHEIGPNPPILLVKIKGSEGVYFEELIPPNEIGSNHVDLKERVRCRREGERENFKWKLQGQRKKIMPYWYTCILFIPVLFVPYSGFRNCRVQERSEAEDKSTRHTGGNNWVAHRQ
jgi:hypothetical protein